MWIEYRRRWTGDRIDESFGCLRVSLGWTQFAISFMSWFEDLQEFLIEFELNERNEDDSMLIAFDHRPTTRIKLKKPWTLAFSDSKSMIWWRHSKCANHILLSLLGLVVRKLNDNLSDNWTELTGSGTCEMIRSLWDVVCHWIDHLLR